jgi:hypothetical protein
MITIKNELLFDPTFFSAINILGLSRGDILNEKGFSIGCALSGKEKHESGKLYKLVSDHRKEIQRIADELRESCGGESKKNEEGTKEYVYPSDSLRDKADTAITEFLQVDFELEISPLKFNKYWEDKLNGAELCMMEETGIMEKSPNS